VHAVLQDVPLHDVWVVELPGGGPGRTLADVRATTGADDELAPNPVVAALFRIRFVLGRLAGWDAPSEGHAAESYVHRLPPALAAASEVPPGTPDGPFRTLYRLERESVSEARNATVHGFLATALVPAGDGYRLFWAVYVRPVSWLTAPYMAAIDPFRRWLVYPALLGRIRARWPP
jgi:hypothetical protein